MPREKFINVSFLPTCFYNSIVIHRYLHHMQPINVVRIAPGQYLHYSIQPYGWVAIMLSELPF